jgi:hypothetical protein
MVVAVIIYNLTYNKQYVSGQPFMNKLMIFLHELVGIVKQIAPGGD